MKSHIVVVKDSFFIEHIDIFQNKDYCKVSRTIIEDDTFKDDEIHRN